MNGVIIQKKRKLVTNKTDSDADMNHSYMEYKQYQGPGGVSTSQMVHIKGKKFCGASTSQFVPAQGQISYMSSTDMQIAVPKKKAPVQNSNKAKLRSKVLKILNTGTQKDVEKLPTIGVKAAEQIITKRLLTGPYKKLKDLEDIPGWKGKRFERFMTANQLNE
ncbi:no distributive disjunction [Carabus blaptoides fortunei]